VEPSVNCPVDVAGTSSRAHVPWRPAANVAAHASLWSRIEQDLSAQTLLAVSKRVGDGVPFPGKALRQWVRNFYQKHRPTEGELELCGYLMDLSMIGRPVLDIPGEKDFICPLPQAKPTMDMIGSQDGELSVLNVGHVGLMFSPVAREELWPRIRDWLGPRPGERT
jgi:polyhydroxyalkanoate synthase subunit PhaC